MAASFVSRLGATRQAADAAERAAWQREAKLGMFVHWGPYSVAGVEASWPILTPNGEITEADYRALPARFNPTLFDPESWIDLARKAGQRYMVFTAKHHDGFCMFDSDYTDYKITRTPYGKDIVRRLSDACHANRMDLGLYYSPPDMNHPGYRDTSKLSAANYRGEPARAEWPLYLEYMGLQLHELLTKYGPVAEVWFDAVDPDTQARYDGQRFVDEVRRLQPAALVNNRLGVPGDFVTPEQFIPKAIPVKGIRMDSPDHSAADRQAIQVPRHEDFQPWGGLHDHQRHMGLSGQGPQLQERRHLDSLDGGDHQPGREFSSRCRAAAGRKNSAGVCGAAGSHGQVGPRKRRGHLWQHLWADSGRAAIPHHGARRKRVCLCDGLAATEIQVRGLHNPVASARLVATGKPVAFKAASEGIRIAMSKELWSEGIPVIELRA